MQVNYLGHWLLTHQLLAGQHQLRQSLSQTPATRSKHNTQQSHIAAPSQQQRESTADVDSSGAHGTELSHLTHHGLAAGSARTEGTRVVMLTSLTYTAGRIRFDDLHAKKQYSGFHRSSDSKLAMPLAAREFAQRMDRQDPRTLIGNIVAAVETTADGCASDPCKICST